MLQPNEVLGTLTLDDIHRAYDIQATGPLPTTAVIR
jgi:hypothetical protein